MKNGRSRAAQKEAPQAQQHSSRHGTEMTGAEMVVQALADQGVEHVFGYPGGAVLPIYDEIIQQDAGPAHPRPPRAGRRPRGRGLCPLDRQGRRRAGHLRPRRHQHGDAARRRADGFDPDRLHHRPGRRPTSSATTPSRSATPSASPGRATKHNWLVRDVNDLSRVLHEAFYVATPGRPGPVLVDIPKDVQFATGIYTGPSQVAHKSYRPRTKGDPQAIRAAIDLIAKAKRPIFYTGGGVVNSGPARRRAAPRARPPHRLPDHLDADGPRRLSRPPTRSGSACSACTAPARRTTSCTTAT